MVVIGRAPGSRVFGPREAATDLPGAQGSVERVKSYFPGVAAMRTIMLSARQHLLHGGVIVREGESALEEKKGARWKARVGVRGAATRRMGLLMEVAQVANGRLELHVELTQATDLGRVG